MTASKGRVLLCNCFKTMSLEGTAGELSSDLAAPLCTELCRGEMNRFEEAARSNDTLLVACTQEAPLFEEVAEELGASTRLQFVNIRETAGWTTGKTVPTAKVLALLADAANLEKMRPAPIREIESDGMCLVYGHGQAALEAAQALEDKLSVTLVLSHWDDVLLPPVLPFPVYSGRLRKLQGSFGNFEVTLDGYAAMIPASRKAPEFQLPRDGARAKCALVVDLSGDTAPITAPNKRSGYFRAAPNDTQGIERLIRDASEMIGTFEKPIYVSYNADICAHSHAGKTGCSNCLDACPAGALGSEAGKIAVDHGICGGCGSCAATCPTGAISYQYPTRPDLLVRIQTLLGAYGAAGGKAPVLLIHESGHGSELINAMARFGDGLPANVLPLSLHAATAIGHDALVTAFLSGAQRVVLLVDPKKAEETAPLNSEIVLTESLLKAMGHDTNGRVTLLCESDPDAVAAALNVATQPLKLQNPTRIAPVGGKRDIARMAITALHRASPDAPILLPLAEKAPYGRIEINCDGCTLCLSCVSACPSGALLDNPDRPQVSFIESACVQCGLCQTTCPEKVISLVPQFNTAETAVRATVLHEEEPATCTSCGKAFGAKSTINRIRERLAGKHQMFQSEHQISLIGMCDDCRIQAQWDADPGFAGASARPRPRTTDDYLEAEKTGLSMDDFLKN
ncbi:4Fe-4S dicluster domain-containing protein [Roseibium sediminis]|uniref:4Fe-4S dicluster domain-containing protein n=1 Tax=Roseibium sediminis TaxID=1775174 RepID=UPI00123CF8E2|nr:4Fe-4S binding protein [Roseibium sediminis]